MTRLGECIGLSKLCIYKARSSGVKKLQEEDKPLPQDITSNQHYLPTSKMYSPAQSSTSYRSPRTPPLCRFLNPSTSQNLLNDLAFIAGSFSPKPRKSPKTKEPDEQKHTIKRKDSNAREKCERNTNVFDTGIAKKKVSSESHASDITLVNDDSSASYCIPFPSSGVGSGTPSKCLPLSSPMRSTRPSLGNNSVVRWLNESRRREREIRKQEIREISYPLGSGRMEVEGLDGSMFDDEEKNVDLKQITKSNREWDLSGMVSEDRTRSISLMSPQSNSFDLDYATSPRSTSSYDRSYGRSETPASPKSITLHPNRPIKILDLEIETIDMTSDSFCIPISPESNFTFDVSAFPEDVEDETEVDSVEGERYRREMEEVAWRRGIKVKPVGNWI